MKFKDLLEILLYSQRAKSYTEAAAAGALGNAQPSLPKEIGERVGSFLNRKIGGRLAETSKAAAEGAAAAERAQETQEETKMSPHK